MINIRKLAAVDMAWLGSRVIVAEYGLGIVMPLALGLLSLRAALLGSVVFGWEAVVGAWLIAIAINYIPLFIYSVLIARAGTVQAEGRPEIAHARRYGFQQGIILVPFFVVLLAVIQETKRKTPLDPPPSKGQS
jgi:hypothetical protein